MWLFSYVGEVLMSARAKVFLRMSLSAKMRSLCRLRERLMTRWYYRWFLLYCGKNNHVGRPFYWTPEFISLGDDVSILPGCRMEGISVYAGKKYTPEIVIEAGVSFQQRCHITAAGRLVLGAGAAILFDVVITDIDHEYQAIGCNILHQPITVSETYIGEYCFIGSGSKILAGTRLGRQCIVGANSVVRGIFPDFSVVAGAPAVIVKRFNPISGIWDKTDKKGNFINEGK